MKNKFSLDVFLLFMVFFFLFAMTVNAQDSTSEILQSLERRLTPAEWSYLQSQSQHQSLFEQYKDLIPWLTTILAIAALVLQQKWQVARDRQAHLYNALHWFEGDTQKRSLGISIIEANWSSAKSLHRTWIAVLTNQAIYLLTQSKQGEASHEVANLTRIMNLLLRHKDQSSVLEYKLLTKELSKKIERNGGIPGLILSEKDIQRWYDDLKKQFGQ